MTNCRQTPIVSICVPAFNAEATIGRCLTSILAQDLSDAEIVVVDNCSSDNTVAIAESMLSRVPRARVITNESNLGRVANWNRCLEDACGRYLKFLFTNDLLLPGSVALMLRTIRVRDGIVMVGSRSISTSEPPQVGCEVPNDAGVAFRSSEETLDFFGRDGFLTGSLNGMLFDLDVIKKHNIAFREDIPYFADFAHAIELAQYGRSAIIDAATYWFNSGAQGRYHFVGLKRPSDFFLEHRACTDRIAELLKERHMNSEVAFQYLLGRYYWYLGEGAALRPWDAWRIFRGRLGDQMQAAFRTCWFQWCRKVRQVQ